MAYITEQGVKYRIRGPYTAGQLRKLYAGFVQHVNDRATKPEHRTKLTFAGWLVKYGKVYNRVLQR